jgi:hypothetical protein
MKLEEARTSEWTVCVDTECGVQHINGIGYTISNAFSLKEY